MAKRSAIIFIDGNNWYHCTKKISTSRDVSFRKLSEFICKHFDLILKDIYYYNSLPDISDGEESYYKQMSFLSSIEKEGIKIRTRKLQRSSNKELISKKHLEIDNLKLCENCNKIVKGNCATCIKPVKKKEKGIDVKIAVDMIRKSIIEESCDCCILISGDADFLSALDLIRTAGKEALSVGIEGKQYASKLKTSGFRFLSLKKGDLIKNYFNEAIK